MSTLLLFLYPLYFSIGENISPLYSFGSQNIFFNPAFMGSEFNPSYTLSLFSTNLALTNNALSISLYNDIMSATGDSLTQILKNKFLGYAGSSWKLNHLSYFSPFSFSIGRFGFGIRFIQGTFLMFPEPWLRLILYGNELDKVYHATDNNTGFQNLNLIQITAGAGHGFTITPDKWRFLYGLNFSLYVSGPYVEMRNVDVYLNTSQEGITGNDKLEVRFDTTFGNMGYGIDLGLGLEYKKLLNFSLGLRNVISNLSFSGGAVTYIHQGDLDSFYIGRDIDYDTLYNDVVDTVSGGFSVKLPFILVLSSSYKDPQGKYSLFFLWEQGFKNTALSTKTPRISLGGEYFVHPRIPLRLGMTFGGYEGFALSLGAGIISRGFSSINCGISQHRGILNGARGLSLSFLIEFHSPFVGEFKGKIIDSLTNKPIARADVFIIDKKGERVFAGKSDVYGEISGKLEPGQYKYEVIARNYYTKKGTLEIKAGKKKEFRVLLKTKFGVLALKVKDKDTEKPVRDVSVKFSYKGKRKEVKTDTLGMVKFKLEKGDYVFRFEHPDYAIKSEKISVEPGKYKEVEVLLATKWGIVKGKVYNAKTEEPLVADIEIYPEEKDSVIKKLKTPADGTYEVRLFEGIYLFKVKAEKYIPQAAYVQVRGGEKLIKDFPMLKEKMVFTFRNIYFDFNSARIRPESYPVLDSIAQMLKDNPTVIVEIGGHADTRGTRAYNKKLTQARANSVKEYLVTRHGIDPSRLIAVGYGEDFPVVYPERSEADYQMNRRVEFKILGERK